MLADPARPGPPPLPAPSGPLALRPVRPSPEDAGVVAGWMAAPHVAPRWDQDWGVARWTEEIAGQVAGSHSCPAFALQDGVPVAYVEVYRVALDRLAGLYPAGPGDLGVHIAIGEERRTGAGLGRRILRWIAEGLLGGDGRAGEPCRRVVAEPNVVNGPALRAFDAAGYRRVGDVVLPHKTAALVVHPATADDLPVLAHR